MTKKLLAVAFSFIFLLLVGCKPDAAESSSTASAVSHEEPEVKPDYTNPLTGVSGYETDISKQRPVAIMINNIKTAQTVQAGVNKADIVYETEVEGGITRLLAVYQNVAEVGQIGTVRSARYAYVDLAMGHNAIYVHHGVDGTYCKPHLKDTDAVTLDTNNYGKRLKNGLASEHTLYTSGSTLWNGLVNDGKKITASASEPWQHFATADETVTLSGGACTSVSIPFSKSYITGFTYDTASGLYTRLFGGTVRTDYSTGEKTEVKNVFVLMTSISYYPDNYHRKIALDNGDGYYITNGTYTPIKWSKGKAASPFVFTNTDGSPLTVSAGSSWVCIANSSTSQPTLQ